MGDQKNLLLAILASLVVLLGFQLLFPTKDVPKIDNSQELNASFAPAPELIAELPKDRNEIINESARVNIENQFINGSINLTGARIDDIIFKKYRIDLSSDSENVKFYLQRNYCFIY